ncbi:heterokaryon incompatibility protein-domain-containing protein, partial [Bisporella sp. PMI_857]
MRLINARTLRLDEFYDNAIPRYAILSHAWGDGEVSFQEWQDPTKASKKSGYAKIKGACRQALKDGLEYLWVDTNCIDKTSSAELTEAINSMFAWYRDAVFCYAYLSDVPTLNKADADLLNSFRKSRWFTRGWTLQELLAPRHVTFYSSDWGRIGTKSGSLAKEISTITGIDVSYLTNQLPLASASIAKKMHWLSRRTTTRLEDMAYCMLGVFDINMPLLYGEGSKAFIRLQEEIIKISNDHTIFCWTWTSSVPPDWVSLLAPSPETFKFSGDFVKSSVGRSVSTYSMTNSGLSIRLPI